MSKILLIGNSGLKHNGLDGQTVKVRLYLKKIKDEGFDVDFIDLENFSRHPFSILRRIKRAIRQCDRIVLITAERGSKILIPYINRINRKLKKPFIFPLIGISVLHNSIDKLSEKDRIDFLVNGNYSLCRPRKSLIKQLRKIDYILPETELLTKAFINFYGLTNVYQLNNFREDKQISPHNVCHNGLRLIYVSRVMAVKGIFDLLDVVKSLNGEGFKVYLDIYGGKHLSDEENRIFISYIDGNFINYKGVLQNDVVCETISNFDLFVFPTKYLGEGTPGVIAESLIAGTPIITSNFPQAKYLLKDGFDSIFYKMSENIELREKIVDIAHNKDTLKTLKKNALISGQKYTYSHERRNFLYYVCGLETKG